jgi:hypothetical protein
MKLTLCVLGALIIASIAISVAPDLARYMKIKSM